MATKWIMLFPAYYVSTGGFLQKAPKAHAQMDEFLVIARELKTSDLPGAPQDK